MADKRLRAAFKEAAELAANVPEEMREIAFNRALDMLLGGQRPGHAAAHGEPEADAPQRSTERVLDQSLRVLNLATGIVGMEALTAKQIGKVLEDRFGVHADNRVIARALDSADFVVDRVMEGGEVLYRLTPSVPGIPGLRGRGGAKAAAAKGKVKTKAGAKHKAHEPVDQTPAQIVNELIAKGFFNSARTVRDVLVYLERKGLQFTATQLYPVMMRLIRAGLLARQKTPDGEYEYRAS